MIHARSIVTIYKRARDKRSRREKRETATATHGEREELEQLPRRDRTRAEEAMVAMPMAAKQQVIARSGEASQRGDLTSRAGGLLCSMV